MRSFFSSTLLLATATIIHALRIIVLSFLLGNKEFGAVSTILLMATLFTEFGAFGFSQLVYNQALFHPWRVSRQSRRIGLFLVTGVCLLLVSAGIVAAIASTISVFQFITIFLTLFSAASNMMVLSACRSSHSSFTHPIAYFIKSIIVIMDIVILGVIVLPVEWMALWGEVVALPILLIYAWYVGILKLRWRIVWDVPRLLASQFRLGMLAISSAASGMLFFNQERLFGVAALTLEQLGILTKLLLPKMIAAQGAFLIGVHFHRLVVRLSGDERAALLARMRKIEWMAIPAVAVAIALGGYAAIFFNRLTYGIDIDYVAGVSVTALALIFFFNPYSTMLQATNRYSLLAVANSAAVVTFVALITMLEPKPLGVAALSAISACLWLVLVRMLAIRSSQSRPTA